MSIPRTPWSTSPWISSASTRSITCTAAARTAWTPSRPRSRAGGFQPDYTFVVEWEAVGEVVDAVGGVNFDVPRRMYYNDLTQHFKIDLQKGYQKLNGSQAMQLLRYHRQRRQRQYPQLRLPRRRPGPHQVQQSFPEGHAGAVPLQSYRRGPIKSLRPLRIWLRSFFRQRDDQAHHMALPSRPSSAAAAPSAWRTSPSSLCPTRESMCPPKVWKAVLRGARRG